jgi:hypothetical protein
MTLDEIKTKLNDEFGMDKVPDHMKGCDFVLLVLCKALWVVEHKQEAEYFRECMFDVIVNLPSSRFYQMQGGRYLELFHRALAESNRPFTAFWRNAIALTRQQAGMLNFQEYCKALGA